jgi:hypothetical protein
MSHNTNRFFIVESKSKQIEAIKKITVGKWEDQRTSLDEDHKNTIIMLHKEDHNSHECLNGMPQYTKNGIVEITKNNPFWQSKTS